MYRPVGWIRVRLRSPEVPSTAGPSHRGCIIEHDTNAFTLSLTGPVIRISVSDNEETVSIHQDVLCSTSEFFKRAVKPEWSSLREDSHIIELPLKDLEALKLYSHWVYFRVVPTPSFPREHDIYSLLCRAYVLGEVLLDWTFKNAIIDIISASTKTIEYFPDGKTVSILYEGTPISSPARRLMVDFYAHVLHDSEDWHSYLDDCPRDFLLDVLKAITFLRPSVNMRPWWDSRETYHGSDPSEVEILYIHAKRALTTSLG